MIVRQFLVSAFLCFSAVSATLRATAQLARIGTDRAEFRFPPDTQRVFQWNVPDSTAYTGRPEFAWEVEWDPPYERFGQDPHILWIIVRWQATGVRAGPLAELLRDARVEVGTFCRSCGTPASTSVADSAVRFELQDD